tara:strand:- start:817 stop:1074 length:258 start_codon:yes stop_codon:yes gene_type:complete
MPQPFHNSHISQEDDEFNVAQKPVGFLRWENAQGQVTDGKSTLSWLLDTQLTNLYPEISIFYGNELIVGRDPDPTPGSDASSVHK